MMKNKIVALAFVLLFMFSVTACKNADNSENSGTLINHMTERERESVSVGEFYSHVDFSTPPITAVYDGTGFLLTEGTDFYLEEVLEQLKEMVNEMDYNGGTIGLAIGNPNYSAENHPVHQWVFNEDELIEIWDFVTEISVYDEEMDFTFIVHVTLPPHFDEDKTYPMFMMTDGTWSFGENHYTLWRMMRDGEIEDVILVSIGFDYNIDGTDNYIRYQVYCEQQELFLNFITDNLTPYLNELYHIDFGRSGLYGASLGGVFAHYAVFNADRYENQPFQYYLVGSPVFWSPPWWGMDNYTAQALNEFGYFDRNNILDKVVFVTGGEYEDQDYAGYYGDYESTITGIISFMDRMEANGITTVTCKIYEGKYHTDYMHEAFNDFFSAHYGLEE